MANNKIAFKAVLNKAQTTIDGGWRVTLDVSQDEADEILKLTNFRDYVLTVGIIPFDENQLDG